MKSHNNISRIFRDYIEVFVLAALLALLVRLVWVGVYRIPTSSMFPGLLEGDFIFVNKLSYGFGSLNENETRAHIHYGDIIVFECPTDPKNHCVKRVVGLPGDQVQVAGGRVQLNGKPLRYEKPQEPSETTFDQLLWESLPESNKKWPVNLSTQGGEGYKEEESVSQNEITINENQVYVLGDNRFSSEDSRKWGTVPAHKIIGPVGWIWLSMDWRGQSGAFFPKIRWERLFRTP